MTIYQLKITFGEISGVRDMVDCGHNGCSHYVETTNADSWPDHVRLSDIEPTFVCMACRKHGAEVRPRFSQVEWGPVRCAPCPAR